MWFGTFNTTQFFFKPIKKEDALSIALKGVFINLAKPESANPVNLRPPLPAYTAIADIIIIIQIIFLIYQLIIPAISTLIALFFLNQLFTFFNALISMDSSSSTYRRRVLKDGQGQVHHKGLMLPLISNMFMQIVILLLSTHNLLFMNCTYVFCLWIILSLHIYVDSIFSILFRLIISNITLYLPISFFIYPCFQIPIPHLFPNQIRFHPVYCINSFFLKFLSFLPSLHQFSSCIRLFSRFQNLIAQFTSGQRWQNTCRQIECCRNKTHITTNNIFNTTCHFFSRSPTIHIASILKLSQSFGNLHCSIIYIGYWFCHSFNCSIRSSNQEICCLSQRRLLEVFIGWVNYIFIQIICDWSKTL